MRKMMAPLLLGLVMWLRSPGGAVATDDDMSIDQQIIAALDTLPQTNRSNSPNYVRVELDMLYQLDVWSSMMRDENPLSRRKRRKAVKRSELLWPNAVVPYVLAASFSQDEVTKIENAMNDYEKYTCIRFRRATENDTDFVKIVDDKGCCSYVGRRLGAQDLSLAPGCRRKPTIIHELGHAIGLMHEHSRPDRDEYIVVNETNIRRDFADDFSKSSSTAMNVGGIPYDYLSIMHYSEFAGGNGKIVIRTRDQKYQKAIGTQNGLSFKDLKLINKVYNCSEQNQCRRAFCPGGGFVGPDCQCWCPSSSNLTAAEYCSPDNQTVQVRLIETAPGQEHIGIVEVLYENLWGLVCDDSWDNASARVICRQLGYIDATSALGSLTSKSRRTDFFLDDVSCTGNETSIENCFHSAWKQHNCGASEVAGVHCQVSQVDANVQVRLVETSTNQEHIGIVEVRYQGVWGIVCDHNWKKANARVVCRQLGYSDARSALVRMTSRSRRDDFFLDDVTCTGNETSIADCSHSPWKKHDCGPNEVAGVHCRISEEDANVQVRLVETLTNQEHIGIVEIRYQGLWGIVCDDRWDIADARVVCRQLGYSDAFDALVSLTSWSRRDDFFLDDVTCFGSETSIADCSHSPWKKHDCDPNEVAGVHCQMTRSTPRGCPHEWHLHEGSCYRLFRDSYRTWREARHFCREQGADLAIVNTSSLNNFLGEVLRNQGGTEAWLGGTDADSEESWKWVDGTLFFRTGYRIDRYNNFSPGEPNNLFWLRENENCLVMYTYQYVWNDVPCAHSTHVFCQMLLN